jgi:hypothetical protein
MMKNYREEIKSLKKTSPRYLISKSKSVNPSYFSCLEGNDVITAKVSDHHPVIYNGVLFWNIMMQGKIRKSRYGESYNNGFGIVEDDKQYTKRLAKIGHVIAEIVYHSPSIEAIATCEGPIQSEHIRILRQSLEQFPKMKKFFQRCIFSDGFYKPHQKEFPNWGLLMLADISFKVSELQLNIKHPLMFEKLSNRVQLWELTKDDKRKYFALGHFPFGGDEHATKKEELSLQGNSYATLIKTLINKYAEDQFIFCADFNFNPYLISDWGDRILDQITQNNSIVLTKEARGSQFKIIPITVDGILLSTREKQRYYNRCSHPGLFSRLVREKSLLRDEVQEHCQSVNSQGVNIQRLGMTPYK